MALSGCIDELVIRLLRPPCHACFAALRTLRLNWGCSNERMRFDGFTHLSFDCYGTLIDWETGILAALRSVLRRHGRAAQDEALLRLYAGYEAEQEAGDYRPYRNVLRGVMAGVAGPLAFEPTEDDLDALGDSVGRWPPFADPVAALREAAASAERALALNPLDRDLNFRAAYLDWELAGTGDLEAALRTHAIYERLALLTPQHWRVGPRLAAVEEALGFDP